MHGRLWRGGLITTHELPSAIILFQITVFIGHNIVPNGTVLHYLYREITLETAKHVKTAA